MKKRGYTFYVNRLGVTIKVRPTIFFKPLTNRFLGAKWVGTSLSQIIWSCFKYCIPLILVFCVTQSTCHGKSHIVYVRYHSNFKNRHVRHLLLSATTIDVHYTSAGWPIRESSYK